MFKVKKHYLYLSLLMANFLSSECHENDTDADITVQKGSLEIENNVGINFNSAKIEEDIFELSDIDFNTCQSDSIWKITAKNAQYDQNQKKLSVRDARVEIMNVPVFWAGNIQIGEEENLNIPNLGITDSEFDFSYKFKSQTDNSKIEIEPIYTNSKFGLSFDYEYNSDRNSSRLQTFLINDDDSSWVYQLNSQFKLTNALSLYIDYSEFSGDSLIQNYGYKFLNIKRRTLDLKQSYGINLLTDRRIFEIGRESFKNISLPRPITHSKDFFRYISLYSFGGWNATRETEYAKFKIQHNVTLLNKILPPHPSADFPYLVYQDVDRAHRNITFEKKSQLQSSNLVTTIVGDWNEYTINYQETKEDIQSASYSIRQIIELSDSSFKFGYIYSSFDDQFQNPLLDSYPKSPSPDSNISTKLWVGKDKFANQRKIFIYNSGNLGSLNYSFSTNLYEEYNFQNEGPILSQFYENQPFFFLLNQKYGHLSVSASGNYSLKKNEIIGLDLGLSYQTKNSYFAIEKRELMMTSYPLNSMDNYLMKFKKDFNNFSFFGRTQYSTREKTINENILGVEWEQYCFRLRLAFERARFFPFTSPDYSNGNYFQQIYLTNPVLKNNLSFEFELVGLSEALKPIEKIIQNGIFN